MSTYTLPDLLKHWQAGEMTTEQAAPKGPPHQPPTPRRPRSAPQRSRKTGCPLGASIGTDK